MFEKPRESLNTYTYPFGLFNMWVQNKNIDTAITLNIFKTKI